MGVRRETCLFGLVLAVCLAGFFHSTLIGGKILSPADVLLVEASFRRDGMADEEPSNRLLMDPVLQFQPWLEFNRTMVRQGRLPLWNPHAGCGAPHLANGQSAVFDPFHLIAYLGTVPEALAWMAACRLWVAGLGAFLLARAWGAGLWGRWFAGLVYPFAGFLIVWLLYPVTPVAIWMPWVLMATDRLLRHPSARGAGALAVVVALLLFGGHVQTAAHVLLASGLLVLWRIRNQGPWRERLRQAAFWTGGIVLGLAIAAVQIIPLGFYLARSPVWGDRQREARAWWTLERPRLLDAACTALPYAFGSQRRGHPNLARAVGVHNLNESAGGYAGLATLLWLAPLAACQRRRHPEAAFLLALAALGFFAAFRLPPIDNLLRALPVLSVTDNRRLSLWIAFSLSMLGGFGLDALARGELPRKRISGLWVLAALVLGMVAASVYVAAPRLEPMLLEGASRHFRASAALRDGITPEVLQARAERQVRAALTFVPTYLGLVSAELCLLAGLSWAGGRGLCGSRGIAAAVLIVTLAELAAFGFDLNPAIDRAVHRLEPPVIARLRAELEPGQRALGIGQELPPNVLMRFGLSDPRNYDSVELAASVNWLASVYEPAKESLTSRRSISWESVARARQRLEASCVAAVVGATPPPDDSFAQTEKVGDVWIAWLTPAPWASVRPTSEVLSAVREPGKATIRVLAGQPDTLLIRETRVAGWTATLDGDRTPIHQGEGCFMAVSIPEGRHVIAIEYAPHEVTYSLFLSIAGAAAAILALTGAARF